MHRWITILIACIALHLAGGMPTATSPVAVAQATKVAATTAHSEVRAGDRFVWTSSVEYASNPAYTDLAQSSRTALLRTPHSSPTVHQQWRDGGGETTVAAAEAARHRLILCFNTRIPDAVLHPVDYYVFRLRRLLI